MSWAEDNGITDFDEDLLQTLFYNKIITQTNKAILLEDDKGQFWLPKSVITEHCEKESYFVYLALNNLSICYFKQYQKIVVETDKALLFQDKKGKFWLPKSMLLQHDLESQKIYYPHNALITIRYIK